MREVLIEPAALAAALAGASVPPIVVDCRYALGQPDAGRLAWLEAHIPGARHADLGRDLSGPPLSDRGRHPLPAPARFAQTLGALGVTRDAAVVAYDDSGGMIAARLWWMLRRLGHAAVAVLDGGWQAWVAAGLPCASGAEAFRRAHYALPAQVIASATARDRLVILDEIVSAPPALLVDARDPARYRGEHEPIDPRAGHIPGARNHPWQRNLDPDGRFRAPPALRAALTESLGREPDADTIYYCGSGVSACHDVLAQVAAGLPEPRLYVGSWSEWCRDGGRAVAIGGESAG